MDHFEALKLLTGGAEGVAEWNRRRDAGEQIPTLSGADLSGVNLAEADLSGADLCCADLTGANLAAAGSILIGGGYSGPQYLDHSGHLDLLRLSRVQALRTSPR